MNARTYRTAIGLLFAVLLPVSGRPGAARQPAQPGRGCCIVRRPREPWWHGQCLVGQSLSSGSTGNVAGVLEFCIKNNYLSGNSGLRSRTR